MWKCQEPDSSQSMSDACAFTRSGALAPPQVSSMKGRSPQAGPCPSPTPSLQAPSRRQIRCGHWKQPPGETVGPSGENVACDPLCDPGESCPLSGPPFSQLQNSRVVTVGRSPGKSKFSLAVPLWAPGQGREDRQLQGNLSFIYSPSVLRGPRPGKGNSTHNGQSERAGVFGELKTMI